MSPRELVVLLGGRAIGRLWQGSEGRYAFAYDPAWREDPAAHPLSLSLPLSRGEHDHAPVRAYLLGLLPDNAEILRRWARQHGVSRNNPFALLARVGEDCAGAVQLVSPARAEVLLSDAPAAEVDWLTEAEVAERLRALHADASAWRRPDDAGFFSLGGAQPKTALLEEGGRWGIPLGRTPTTHILKPPVLGYEGFAENEHLCLRLAAALGISASVSRVVRFEDQAAIVVERYDRVRTPAGVVRVHQEDLCQAHAVLPEHKYERQGGPGAGEIVRTLRDRSTRPERDVTVFLDALALNWIIGGTDAHAKNYSILFEAGGGIRLAPLYDVISVLPYETVHTNRRLRLAMKVGGEYRLLGIGRRQWREVAALAGAEPDELVERVRLIAEEVPDRLHDVRVQAEAEGLSHPVLARLEDSVAGNARRCAALLAPPA